MRRRELLGSLLAVAAAPARAQLPSAYRIAFVHSAFPTSKLTEATGPFWVRRFFEELRRLGFAEGQNLSVQRYSAEGDPERHTKLAAEIAATNPVLIVANSNLLVNALRSATEIPIVGILADPLSHGTVTNLARPQGNVTGVSIDAGIEVNGKRLAILKQAIPSISRVAFLTLPIDWTGAGGDEVRRAATTVGVTVLRASPAEGGGPAIRAAVESALADGADGLLVSAAGEWLSQRETIIQVTREHRLPAMYPYRDFVEAGGLIAYSPDLKETATRLAEAVAQVLRGKHPRDIPIQQATKFDLVISLAAARRIEVDLAAGVQAQADEVIE